MAQAAVIAITLVAGTAFAGEDCTDGAAAPLVPQMQQAPSSPVPVGPASTTVATAEEELTELPEFIVMGGISAPNEAEWVDETQLPELPVIAADAPLPAARDSALD